jgi:SecD/SecF fusion protein
MASRSSSTDAAPPPGRRTGGARSKHPKLLALLALLVLVGATVASVLIPPKLGLDLRGGTQIVLEAQDTPAVKVNAEATQRALEVLRRRVDALGVAEPTLVRSGERRIVVELPGLQDPREAAEVIGRTAQLSFHAVTGPGDPSQPTEGLDEEATPSDSPSATPSATASPSASPTATDGAPDATDGTGDDATGDAATGDDAAADETTERQVLDEDGAPIRIGPAVLTGEGVKGAEAGTDPTQGVGWFVTVDFTGDGGKAWFDLTAKASCAPPGDPQRRVAILLDNQVISSPQVSPEIACGQGIPGGSTQITGNFTAESSSDLAALIKGGALPVPVEVIEQRTVGPTLGADAIDASWKAGLLGVAITALFIIVIYRLVGLMATIALTGYAVISYAALVTLGATLTLPGLAGFVLAIGMAVDANVLVFERAREEYAAPPERGPRGTVALGQNLQSALINGFSRAWSAILDSNVTTLLAAGLLFFLASGPVRGFGVTLSIGVLASMVSALLVTRVLAEFVVSRKSMQRKPLLTGIGSTGRVRQWLERRNPDLMGRRRIWLAVSGVLVVLALTGIGVRGLNLGVEFTGGRLVELSTTQQVDVNEARQAVADAGFPRAVVQESGEDDITVRDAGLDNQDVAEIREVVSQIGGEASIVRDELIGPSLGNELRVKALIALGIALLAQLTYLAFRFRWTYALSAVISMFQDLSIVVGLFAWLGKPIDGVFLAAVLTVIGYSVNDTVVVFDRVRENRTLQFKLPFAKVTNDAILQTIPRTVNTGIGALAILAALALLGGDSLTDFAVALLVGIVAGTASTVFTASPLAVEMEKRWPGPAPRSREGEKAAREARRRRDPSDSGAVV